MGRMPASPRISRDSARVLERWWRRLEPRSGEYVVCSLMTAETGGVLARLAGPRAAQTLRRIFATAAAARCVSWRLGGGAPCPAWRRRRLAAPEELDDGALGPREFVRVARAQGLELREVGLRRLAFAERQQRPRQLVADLMDTAASGAEGRYAAGEDALEQLASDGVASPAEKASQSGHL